jgi:hypothetical protein
MWSLTALFIAVSGMTGDYPCFIKDRGMISFTSQKNNARPIKYAKTGSCLPAGRYSLGRGIPGLGADGNSAVLFRQMAIVGSDVEPQKGTQTML